METKFNVIAKEFMRGVYEINWIDAALRQQKSSVIVQENLKRQFRCLKQ
jgi:hypothetical protein